VAALVANYREQGSALVAGEQVFLHMEMGWALAQRGVYGEALQSYKTALALDPDNAIAWFRCGGGLAWPGLAWPGGGGAPPQLTMATTGVPCDLSAR
jgi:tetratricopeptide (TPR) repeat protein